MPTARGGQGGDLIGRYSYLAGSGAGAVSLSGLVALPWTALRVLSAPSQVRSAAAFVVLTAPIALLRPWTLLALLPGLLLALLSAHPEQRQLSLQYGVELVPIALAGAVVACAALQDRLNAVQLSTALLVPALTGFAILSPLAPWHSTGPSPSQTHREAVLAGLAFVPTDARVSVSAQSGLLPRLSERVAAYEFPSHAASTDWVVLDQYGFRSNQSIAAGFDAAEAAVVRQDSLIYSKDGVEVWRRATP